jgi:hypothetical protein
MIGNRGVLALILLAAAFGAGNWYLHRPINRTRLACWWISQPVQSEASDSAN